MLDGAPNFRDLGGLLARDGRRVRAGFIYRSGSLSGLTERDLDIVTKLGIRLVCDMRSERERKAAPNRWLPVQGVEELHIEVGVDLRAGEASLLEILRHDPNADGARRMMLQTYRNLPNAFSSSIRGLFARLVDGDCLPVIFHCTAGKDRTGFLIAIILHALGVSRDTIYRDYLRSTRNGLLRESAAQAMAIHFGAALDASVIDVVAGVDALYLHEAFSAMAASHGSVERYLEDVAGLDPSQLHRLRDALLE
ncbi:tyrosine-protein phosphatase [Paraburkholderia sp. CNPSo 3281]|uniref:tyrosine-protein phosphatase n=1 Tax=Paraburkholderia sp. CNPSo 3281 TaxID=2940933 RepID=UPI0020B80139|nr:tyrosine-protein phosphatase [Paraburkholderia sp. CNPSo 3281]MCP3715344.1 tyrosine-protein phosphatase [Paraburkholderia sp. CNPSo 3281]